MIIDKPTLRRENNDQPFKGVIHIGDEIIDWHLGPDGTLANNLLFINKDKHKIKAFHNKHMFSSISVAKFLSEEFSKKTFKQVYREQKGRIDLDSYDLISVESDPNIIKGFDNLFETFQGIKAIYFRNINDPDKIFDLDVWLMTYQFEKKLVATVYNNETNKNEYDLFYMRK
jgi:hypothetical protein